MSAPAAADGFLESRLDPGKPRCISIFGRKGSGKSVLARRFWDSWPHDRLAIDPAGDFAGDEEGIEDLEDPLPHRLPGAFREAGQGRRSFRYRPDPGSDTYRDDLDRAAGLAFWTPREKPMLLHIDEVGELTQANRTGPNMRRVLHQARHRRLSVTSAGPRPKDIDPLVLSQSDFIYLFEMPHPLDRERIAASVGIKRPELDTALDELPKFHYLRYDADPSQAQADALGLELEELRLLQFPPVPLPKARKAAEL
jgi:hypothetical protein